MLCLRLLIFKKEFSNFLFIFLYYKFFMVLLSTLKKNKEKNKRLSLPKIIYKQYFDFIK